MLNGTCSGDTIHEVSFVNKVALKRTDMRESREGDKRTGSAGPWRAEKALPGGGEDRIKGRKVCQMREREMEIQKVYSSCSLVHVCLIVNGLDIIPTYTTSFL